MLSENFAYTNNYADLNPFVKVLSSLAFIIISLANSNLYLAVFLIFFVILLTLRGAKIPLRPYIKMLFIPMVYLLISLLTIVVSLGFTEINEAEFLFVKQLSFLNFYIGIVSIEEGLTLALRAVGAIVGMYFLILTTPFNQQIVVLKKVKTPNLFIELYMLTYRFIGMFFEESKDIYMAQKNKFAYTNYKDSMNSLSLLIKVLFIRMMNRYKEMENILEMKFFDGNFYTE